ncbi:MAG TPA: glycerophosphodiester phosphodiesterase family protein [Candidatus Nanoarchaeia archaeon]|nr:glycerophosphodiester phosphodiesterase family protein [Candidatus Nanoarchaeia archaeon]
MKPLIMAHRGGDCFATENSLEAIQQSLRYQPDIIEIDVRKSTDGVIYCYHGQALEFILPGIFFKKTFSELKMKYPTIVTLKEIVSVVADKCVLFVDVKDNSIPSEELVEELKQLSKVYLASQSLKFLEKLPPLPFNWKTVCNGGVWLLTNKKYSKIISSRVNILELFWWDFSRSNLNQLKENQIETALASWLLPQKLYLNECFSKNSAWVWIKEFYKLKNR